MQLYPRHPRILARSDTSFYVQNWLNTPDHREGWASYFLRQGYVVYLTDHPQRGRSGWLPGEGEIGALSATAASTLFAAPEKIKPQPYPQANLHTQWPGSGLPGDPVFDTFYASQVQFQTNATIFTLTANHSYVSLVDQIGEPVLVVTHSQAGAMGWQLGDARPSLVAGIVALEPGAPPFETWTGPPYAPGYMPVFPPTPYGVTILPVAYDPPLPDGQAETLERQQIPPVDDEHIPCTLQAEPARQLVNLAQVSVLQIVGEASFQAPYSYCVARYLEQAGVSVDFVALEDAGIHGTGHFTFMEKNSIEIAARVVLPWLESRGSE